MARRSDHSKEELKELAIKAGHNIIKKQGFKSFSARGAAAAIGYTVGTLYHVFGSLDDYILNINARTLDHWYATLETLVQAKKGRATLNDLASFYIDFSAKHYNEWSALFEHAMAPGLIVPGWYMEKMQRFFLPVESLVLSHTKGNQREAHRAARVLWAGIHGICILSLTRKLDLMESESTAVLAKSFVDNYLKGLNAT